MEEQADRKTDKMILEIEVSDIVFKQHQKTYLVTMSIITVQLILGVLLVVLQTVFKDVKVENTDLSLGSILGLMIPIFNMLLIVLVVINNKISNKAWNIARESYQKLFEIADPVFNKSYNLEDQYHVIENMTYYKKERSFKNEKSKLSR